MGREPSEAIALRCPWSRPRASVMAVVAFASVPDSCGNSTLKMSESYALAWRSGDDIRGGSGPGCFPYTRRRPSATWCRRGDRENAKYRPERPGSAVGLRISELRRRAARRRHARPATRARAERADRPGSGGDRPAPPRLRARPSSVIASLRRPRQRRPVGHRATRRQIEERDALTRRLRRALAGWHPRAALVG